MAMTLTTKFAQKVDERFYAESVTQAGTNQDYSWEGAQTIKVSSFATAAMKDYNRGTGKAGTPETLENTIQTMTLTKDRYFECHIDAMDEEETAQEVGKAIERQNNEVITPEIEAYRLETMLKGVDSENKITFDGTVEKSYSTFLKANKALNDKFVPKKNRVAFTTYEFANLLKENNSFMKAGDLSQKMLIEGSIGMVDGVNIVPTYDQWLTDGTDNFECLIAHPSATVAPIKTQKVRVFDPSTNQKGFSTLIDGRTYYDCFILNNKKYGLSSIQNTGASTFGLDVEEVKATKVKK